MSTPHVFNPLDKKNLGESVVQAIERITPVKLAGLKEFNGAGIYAIYYSGGFAPYLPLAVQNHPTPTHPIYVGKAVAAGARKGIVEISGLETKALWLRLRKHAESIRAGADLDLADFHCRYLVIDEIWIGLGESLLIQAYAPLWNTTVEGFGNNDPGAGRLRGKRPAWDELHPGRSWAARLKAAKLNRAGILTAIGKHMARFNTPTE